MSATIGEGDNSAVPLGGTELLDEDAVEEILSSLASLDMAHIMASKAIYDHVTSAFPVAVGKAASKKEREEQQLKATTLVYGEISFESFGTCLEKIKKVYGRPEVGSSGDVGILQNRGGIFYDLGAGTGKAVVAAAILHNFDQCIGFEILEGLFSVSLDMQVELGRVSRCVYTSLYLRLRLWLPHNAFPNLSLMPSPGVVQHPRQEQADGPRVRLLLHLSARRLPRPDEKGVIRCCFGDALCVVCVFEFERLCCRLLSLLVPSCFLSEFPPIYIHEPF